MKNKIRGRVEFFYRALQADFFIDFSSDVDCDAEVFTPNPESASWILKINDLDYRSQNDFGLASVSTDNLGESSEKLFGGVG